MSDQIFYFSNKRVQVVSEDGVYVCPCRNYRNDKTGNILRHLSYCPTVATSLESQEPTSIEALLEVTGLVYLRSRDTYLCNKCHCAFKGGIASHVATHNIIFDGSTEEMMKAEVQALPDVTELTTFDPTQQEHVFSCSECVFFSKNESTLKSHINWWYPRLQPQPEWGVNY